MNERRVGREQGFGMLMLLVPIVFLMVLAAALSSMVTSNQRTASRGTDMMRAYYVADSGAQIGNAMVRASAGLPSVTSFTEAIGGGAAAVDITKLTSAVYRVVSTGTYRGEQRTVEIQVLFRSVFGLASGVQMAFNKGVRVKASVPVHLEGGAMISGLDHAADGTLLVDQTNGTYGLGMNPLPGSKNLKTVLNGSSIVEGIPEPLTGDVTGQSNFLLSLKEYAQSNADVFISGSSTLGDASSGLYGTAASPALIYATVGSGTLTLGGTFTGYGTLVVDVAAADLAPALELLDSASWNGLILLYFAGPAEVDGGSLVSLDGGGKIIGGMAMLFDGDNIELQGAGSVLRLGTSSSILYSSDLISTSPGIIEVSDTNVSPLSYRLQ